MVGWAEKVALGGKNRAMVNAIYRLWDGAACGDTKLSQCAEELDERFDNIK